MKNENVTVNVEETRPVFLVMTNEDLTEGRSREYPAYVCWSKFTANRLAKGRYVMGSNAPVIEAVALKIEKKWFVAGNIVTPTPADTAEELEYTKKKEELDRFVGAVKACKDAGMSEETIRILTTGGKLS